MASDKQAREKMRIALKKEYESKYATVIDKANKYDILAKQYSDLALENEQLKDKLCQYEDWVERLSDCANMTDAELQAFKNDLKNKESLSNAMSLLTGSGGTDIFRTVLGLMAHR